MGLRINQNVEALNAYRNLSVTSGQMSKSLEKLSSGYRINRAADDAAGLSISEGLRGQIGGLKTAVRNAQDGISVVQTAEGALTEVHGILQRMRDLAVQASNTGSQDISARQAAQTEFTQLNLELDRIGSTTSFGTQKLLGGGFGLQNATQSSAQVTLSTVATGDKVSIAVAGSVTVAATAVTVSSAAGTFTDDAAGAEALQKELQASIDGGALKGHVTASVKYDSLTGDAVISFSRVEAGSSADTMTTSAATNLGWTAAGPTAPTGTAATFQVGANQGETLQVSISAVNSTSLGTTNADLVTNAAAAISTVNNAIASVSNTRATLGAYQNRFEHTINNLNVAVENLSASESRIRDTDMASEMVAFTRSQILSQAGTAMLAQANQAPQNVLQLLR